MDGQIVNQPTNEPSPIRLVLITGPSGAGRTTAINALEDIGYDAIDNLPLSLLPRLLSGPPIDKPLALGVDARNREFEPQKMLDVIGVLGSENTFDCRLLYVTCDPKTLSRRFSETRRRHPLADDQSAEVGIAREFDLIRSLEDHADTVIDTSDMTPHDLRSEIERQFSLPDMSNMSISIESFSYKRGVPRGVDLAFDCRFLANPHWEQSLRNLNGLDLDVQAYVQADQRFAQFFTQVTEMLKFLIPAYKEEGKSHLTIAFGCTGGQHRSVSLALLVGNALESNGWQVSLRHSELERRGLLPNPNPQE
jgi:UPF0042 nucleotide-binding protein